MSAIASAARLQSVLCLFGLVVMASSGAPPASAQPARTASAVIKRPAIDLKAKPLPRVAPGVVIGQENSSGYSDLVTLVLPRLSSGYLDSLPEYSKRYAAMFKFTVLANVVKDSETSQHLLDKVAIGFAMDIKGKMIAVTEGTANQYGAELGMIDRRVLRGNEDCLDDVVQIARTNRMVVFDAKANMLIGTEHEERVLRHFVWVSPKSGSIGFLVWQLNDGGAAAYEVDSRTMQLLPPGFKEDRQIHVSDAGFLNSIPTPARFALVQVPQGTAIPISPAMKKVAGKKSLTPADLQVMVSAVAEGINSLRKPKS